MKTVNWNKTKEKWCRVVRWYCHGRFWEQSLQFQNIPLLQIPPSFRNVSAHIHRTLSFVGLFTTPEVWNSDTSSTSQENVVSLLVIVFSLYFWPSVAGYSGQIYFTVNLLSLLIWAGRSHLRSLCPCSFLRLSRFTRHSSQSCCHFCGCIMPR